MNGILIIGKECTGKGRVAKVMLSTCGKEVCTLSVRNASLETIEVRFREIPKSTEVLYMPEFPLQHLDYLVQLSRENIIVTHNKGQWPNAVSPQIVAEIDCSYDDLSLHPAFLQRFMVMECLGSNDHDISVKMHHPIEIDDVYKSEVLWADIEAWAGSAFVDSIGKCVEFESLLFDYRTRSGRSISAQKFKRQLKLWCSKNSLVFNPADKTDKSGRIIRRVGRRVSEFIFIGKMEVQS